MQSGATGEAHARKTIERHSDCLQEDLHPLATPAVDMRNRSHVLLSKTAIRIETCSPCGQEIQFCKQFFRCRDCQVICHPECKEQLTSDMHSECEFQMLHQKASIYENSDCHQDLQPLATSAEDMRSRTHVLLSKTAIRTEMCSPCGQGIEFCKQFFRCMGCQVMCHPECREHVTSDMHSEYKFLQKASMNSDCLQDQDLQLLATPAEDTRNLSHVLLSKTAIRTQMCSPCGQEIQFCKQFFRCKDCQVICHPECKELVTSDMHSEYKFQMLQQKSSIYENPDCLQDHALQILPTTSEDRMNPDCLQDHGSQMLATVSEHRKNSDCFQDHASQILATASEDRRNPDCLQDHVSQVLATAFEDRRNRSHVFLEKTAIRTEKCSPCGQDIKFCKQFFRCTGCRITCHTECKDKVSRAMHSEYKFHMLLPKTSIRSEKCTACDLDIRFCEQILKCTGCQVICHLECKEQVIPAMHSNYP